MSANPQNTETGPEKNTRTYKVCDLNQGGDLPRVHDVIVKSYPDNPEREPDVMTYRLYSDDARAVDMPYDHAIIFLRDPKFKVMDGRGRRIPPMVKVDHTAPLKVLGHDQVVVTYDQVSREVLYRMAKQTPNGDRVPHNADVGELATYMTEWRKSLVGSTTAEQDLAAQMAAMGGAMSNDQLENMFPKKAIA